MQKGDITIRGNASKFHATFYVGVSDGKGGTLFGTECTAAVMGGFGRETPDVEVQIGGLSAHDYELGRQRAAAYLRACGIAENLESGLTTSKDILGVFVAEARFLHLEITVFGDEGAEAHTPTA